MKRQSLFVALVLFAFASALHAHHPQFIKAFGAGMAERDFTEIRALFTDDAWEGADDGVSAKELADWLTKVNRRMFVSAAGEERLKTALAMGIKFYKEPQGAEPSEWLYIHMVPADKPIQVRIRNQDFTCNWRIVRLTKSIDETEKFLGEKPEYLVTRAKKQEGRERERIERQKAQSN